MWFLVFIASLHITEVFVRSSDKKPGQQWFEIFNSGLERVNLNAAKLRRLDGQKKQEAWVLKLPSEDFWLESKQYVVIAERRDLGRHLCSNLPVLELKDKQFSIKTSGIQRLCVEAVDQKEVCAVLSDSKKIEADVSRNLVFNTWEPETCELTPGFFASPGLPLFFCSQEIASPWHDCPAEEPVLMKEAPKKKQLSGGCSQAFFSQEWSFWLMLMLFATRRLKHR